MIRKSAKGYSVISHRTGRNMGTYASKEDAERRLRQVKAHARRRSALGRGRGY